MDEPVANAAHFVNWYDNQTWVEPAGLAVFLAVAAAMLVVRRGAGVIPLLLVASLLSTTQRVVVLGMDFPYMRLLLVLACIRITMRGEWVPLRKLHSLDWMFILSIVAAAVISTLRIFTMGKLIHRVGWSFDAIALYLVCRAFLQNWRDLDRFAKWCAIVAAVIAPFFIVEWQTGRNYFAELGGIAPLTEPHHGRIRASGSYSHSILAGCFWLTLMPLIVARFWNPRASRSLAFAGLLGALAIIIACASSTPVLGLVFALGASFLFPLRLHLKWFRRASVAILLFLHLVMNAPVWHLIARVNVIGGSTGWHRFNLIDQFINRVGEWWLMGTSYTGHWGNNLVDLTNVYVAQGVRGGILNLAIYIAMLTLAFRRVGHIYRGASSRPALAFGWALGIALFANAVVQMAVSFYGEILFAYYGLLAAIGSMPAAPAPAARRVRARARARATSGRAQPQPAGAALESRSRGLTRPWADEALRRGLEDKGAGRSPGRPGNPAPR